MTANISPAKKIRSLKRLLVFRHKKMTQAQTKPLLAICPQQIVSVIPSKPRLSISTLPSIDIPPSPPRPNLARLDIKAVQCTSIPPKPFFRPAIIRASLSMFEKKPGELNAEEIEKFNLYRKWKIHNGEPIEQDILYNRAGGNEKCLQCELPT
jgi:hypothetical protein